MVVQVPGPPWTTESETQAVHHMKQEPLLDEQVEATGTTLSDNQSLVTKPGLNMVIKQEKADPYDIDAKDAFVFAVPAKKAPSMSSRSAALVEWKNTLNMRQVMLGSLAARREQFDASLGTSHTPRASGRSTRPGVGAAKSLDLLRINLQAAINKDIQQVLNKYLERFFQPAMENIRSNLGSESVVDDHVRAVCQRVLEEAKQMYLTSFQSESKTKSERIRESHKWHQSELASGHATHSTTKPHYKVQLGNKSYQPIQLKPHYQLQAELKAQVQNFPNLRSACGAQLQSGSNHSKWQTVASTQNTKRKASDFDFEPNHRKRNRPCELSCPQPMTVSRMLQVAPINYQGPKWDPARITKDTFFVMGARANKVLGYGQARGRLYLKHQDLFKYCGDEQDREWLAQHNLMAPSSGKAYLMLMQDIQELALSDEYKNNPNLMLQELKGFRAPEFMLNKIRSYLNSLRAEPLADLSELLDMQLLPEFYDKEGKFNFDSGQSSSALLDSGVPSMDDSLMELALEYGVTLMSDNQNQLDVPNQLSSSSTVLATLPPSLEALTLTQGVNSSRSASSCSSLSPSVSPSPPACLPACLSPPDSCDSPSATTQNGAAVSTPVSATTPTASAAVSSSSSRCTRARSSSLTPSANPTNAANSSSNAQTVSVIKHEPNILESQTLGLSLELPISPTLEELELLIKTESCLSTSAGESEGLSAHSQSSAGPSGTADAASNTILATIDPQTDVFDHIMRADVAANGKIPLSSSVGSQTTPDLNLDAGLDASLDANLDLNLDVNLDVNLDTMTEATALEIAYLGLMLDGDASNTDIHGQSPNCSNNENYPQITIPPVGMEANLGESSLAMSHATLSALLSGNTLEGLEIPDALL